ncbi:GNAT family N-acetyltransferase [Alloalcanivorax xenomutans]|uniref:GNAT family N-acetyltransferase n=1 Tax=Alloalcanivorax xenomutans TaxID=1094342 RepID=UPI0004B3DB14|tara:strand:- start:2379 stop:2981 length:603 start_codon:yes stop_codon:yes gene_type:complete
MSAGDERAERLPREQTLADKSVLLRLMTQSDQEPMLRFASALPDHDLLFLMRDITQPAVIRKWLDEVQSGRMIGLVAEGNNRFLGTATVIPSDEPWSTHVGELRVLVSVDMRGTGLGTVLVQEAFASALDLGMERLVVRMTPDQKGAIAVFEGLGFRPEGVLRDHVRDLRGKKHDLLVMGHDVRGFQAVLGAYGFTDALS